MDSRTRPEERIARPLDVPHAQAVPDPVIEREEVVPLLFNVSDIARSLEMIHRLFEGEDGEEEADAG